jgi:hypothetical protein
MRRKSEVYSWRVSPALKAGLEESARRQRRPVAAVLEQLVRRYLASGADQDEAAQQRLHARAARFAGRLTGSTRRAANARALVRQRLRRRRAI